MTETSAVNKALRKGVVIGFASAILFVAIVLGIPTWWFSSGRDAQTLHDGLSAGFRTSLGQILTVDGFEAKSAAYDNSVTITSRDNVFKYGAQVPGKYTPGPS